MKTAKMMNSMQRWRAGTTSRVFPYFILLVCNYKIVGKQDFNITFPPFMPHFQVPNFNFLDFHGLSNNLILLFSPFMPDFQFPNFNFSDFPAIWYYFSPFTLCPQVPKFSFPNFLAILWYFFPFYAPL